MRKSILIIKLSALGDVVQAVDAFRLFAKPKDEIHVTWAVAKGYEPLLEGVEGIDEIISVPRKWSFSTYLAFRREHRQKQFDEVIDLQGLLKSWLVTCSVQSKGAIGFGPLNSRDWLVPRLARKTLNGTFSSSRRAYRNLFEMVFSKLLETENSKHDPCSKMLKRVFCAPGSGQKTKTLEVKQWVDLLKALREDLPEVQLQWVAGSQEEHRWIEEHQEQWKGYEVLEPEKWNLSELKEQMQSIDLWIGMDSGPSHLAAQLNVTTLLFYGPSSPSYYNPEPMNGLSFRGACHLEKQFHDRCDLLRVCETCSAINVIDTAQAWKSFYANWVAHV